MGRVATSDEGSSQGDRSSAKESLSAGAGMEAVVAR
ncbi:MAG: hypothetical protein ACI8QS_003129 [Planctomycetota bacterium]|jgi:hypothetical protein